MGWAPSSACFLRLSHTDAQENSVYTPGNNGAGGAVMGPVACVMVRVLAGEGVKEAGAGTGCPGTQRWAWASLTWREVGGLRGGFRERPRQGGLPARAPSGRTAGRGTLRVCGRPAAASGPLRSPLRFPILGTWPSGKPLDLASARTGPFGLLVLHRSRPQPLRLHPTPWGCGGAPERGLQWLLSLVEFQGSRHLLRDQVRSPLGPLAPVAAPGLPLPDP